MGKFKRFERIVSIAGLAAAAILSWWTVQHYEVTEVWVRQAGWWGPLVSIGLYALLSLTPIPSDPLTLLNGVLFGWTEGLFISWMGNNAAALVEYVIFLNVRNFTHFDHRSAKIPSFLARWPVNSPAFLILGRFVPGFGGKVVSIMAGMYHVSWQRYTWTTMVANLIGAIIYAVGGWGVIYSLKHFVEWIDRL